MAIDTPLWTPSLHHKHLEDPIIRHFLKLWEDIDYSGRILSPVPTSLASFASTPSFTPGYDNLGQFLPYIRAGLTRSQHFLQPFIFYKSL